MKNRSISDSFNMKFIKEVYLYMNGEDVTQSIMTQEFLLDLQGDNYV